MSPDNRPSRKEIFREILKNGGMAVTAIVTSELLSDPQPAKADTQDPSQTGPIIYNDDSVSNFVTKDLGFLASAGATGGAVLGYALSERYSRRRILNVVK